MNKHASDCAMHNAPAYPAGPCDCGASGEIMGGAIAHLAPWQQRMVHELAELDERTNNLGAFLERLNRGDPAPEGVDQHEIDLLVCQFAAMSAYHAALHARVRRFRG